METEREGKMGVFEATILHHVCIVLALLWLLSCFNFSHPVFYFVSLIYLYLVHERYEMRLRKKLQFEERMQSNQRRVLTDSESVRWLNHAIEKIWPVCMEQIVSQKILLPIIPWFLDKYKPWTVRKSVVEFLYMGRSPPLFTEMRVLRQTTGDDHLVLELGMNFRTADDMSAILAVKLAKRMGGMRAKLHLKGLHVEGKVLIGIKFVRHWPFLGRVRLCFVEPPFFQMIVKPIFNHGLDVTEVPGIAGWLDKLLALAFEQTLVEPNMLVVDVEKFASPQPENWFSIDEKESIAYALVEVIEGADMKPSDLNGLADPYVKGQLGPYRFRTKTQWKTLAPKWHEEFKVPICTWESPNVLAIEVRDKDQFMDDTLGDCSVNINNLRGGQRHDLWLSLRNIKTGQLHLAVTVVEGRKTVRDLPCDNGILNDNNKSNTVGNESAEKGSLSSGGLEKSPNLADKFEPIDIEGQKETGIWVHHPGSEVSQIWEPRKGRRRVLDSQVIGNSGNLELPSASCNNDNISTDGGSQEGKKGMRRNKVLRGLKKIGTVFSKNSKKEDMSGGIEGPIPSPHANLKAINGRKSHVKLIVEEDDLSAPSLVNLPISEGKVGPEGISQESPSKRPVKDMAKSILKNAGKSAHGVKHVFDRKGPKMSQGDSGLVVTNGDISSGSESSDEESPASSVCTSEGNPVIPKPLSSSGNDSFKSEALNDQNTPFDFPLSKDSLGTTEKISSAWPGNKNIDGDYPPKPLSSSGNDSFKSEALNDQNTPFDFPLSKDSLGTTENISSAWPGNKNIDGDYPSTKATTC